MTGTFNVARDLWEDQAFRDEPFSEREAWVWLIAEASWKPRTKRVGDRVVSLNRGQLAVSTRFMASAWKWTHGKSRRFLERLQKLKMLTIETGTGVTVISLTKYDTYQSGGTPTGTGSAQDRHRTGTNEKKGERREEGKEEDPYGSLSLPCPAGPVPADDVSEAVNAYNETASASGWPRVQKLTPARRSALKARMGESGGIEGWRSALEKAAASDFLCGRSARGSPFQASFDFLTRQSSFAKLMEGNYDNRLDHRPGAQAAHGRPHRPDAALEQISRLAGLGATSGHGGR